MKKNNHLQLQPFCPEDYQQTLDNFLGRLKNVPNYERKIKEVIRQNPNWLKLARKAKKDNGCIWFYIEYIQPKKIKKESKIEIRVAECHFGKMPTIILSTPI